jgi:hypothetical protein
MWGFGWLTRLGSPFLKIFWTDISKNLKFFYKSPEIARGAGKICSLIAADTAATNNRRGEARIPRSSVLFRFACLAHSVNSVK